MPVALVTGSTGGLGQAVAKHLARQGIDLVVNGRSEESGEAFVTELENEGVEAHFEQADINEYSQVEAMVEGALDAMGHIDILVNSGGAASGPEPNFFRDTPPEDFLKHCRTQYVNRMYAIKAVLEHMVDSGGGRIINLSTDAGRVPTPGEVSVGAAGAALQLATRTLANELSRWNITVNTVCISVVEGTEALEMAQDSSVSSIFKEALDRQSFSVTDDDIGDVISYLATADGAQPMTGQIISVNGGISYPG
jgi:2-hydroxycyclohexanecarboxyl-CoA dehydrogenase